MEPDEALAEMGRGSRGGEPAVEAEAVTREGSRGVHVDHHHVYDKDVGFDDAPQGGRRAERTTRRGSGEPATCQRARGWSSGGLEEPLSRSARAGAQRSIGLAAAEAHTAEAAAREIGRTSRGTSTRGGGAGPGEAGAGGRALDPAGWLEAVRCRASFTSDAREGSPPRAETRATASREPRRQLEVEPRWRVGSTSLDANVAG